MIYAWRGVGKTFVALNIAYAVASGGEFLGWKAERAHPVLYLDGEMVAADLQQRLRAMVREGDGAFDPAFLRIVTPDLQRGSMPDLATTQGQAAIEQIVEAAKLIVVDNISCLVRDASAENEAESWNGVGAWALRMRQAGRSVLFLHHSSKAGSQRGSSKKEDALDVVVCLKRPPTTRRIRAPDSRSISRNRVTAVASKSSRSRRR
jgi:RecA-family ATPase